MPKKIKKVKKVKKSKNDILQENINLLPGMTNTEVCKKFNVSSVTVSTFMKKNNIKNKRKKKRKSDDTLERLKIIKGIDTSKTTQKQLQEMLGFNNRAATSLFCKRNNVKFKTKRRL